MCALMALMAQAVIVGWQVYSMTKSLFLLGLTGLAEAVPAIICALFAGHIVDISRPYIVYIGCILALVINTLMLFLIAGDIIHAPGGNPLPWIFAGIFFSGIARSFVAPASFSLFPQIVPRKDTSAASAWMSSGFQFASILGPAIAGIIYGGYGARAAWLIPVILMCISFITILGISHHPRKYKSDSIREPAAKSIKTGWRFILRNPVMLSVMTLDMFAVLLGGAIAILPAYADQVLHVGSEGLGALRAAPAIGAIITALMLSVLPMQKIRGTTLLLVVAGFGVSIIGFGLSTHFYLSLAFLAISGAFDSVSMIIRATIMQLLTPDNMRGRVSSVNSMFIVSSNEIGAFKSGISASFMGLIPSVVFGGIGTLIVVAVTALLSPGLRKAVVDPNSKNH
ncbi:MAG: transporter [Rickettsiaceae bacterium]|nr:transporter [Rickettsiaceae bacterium]